MTPLPPSATPLPTDSLWQQVQAHYGLSQAALGRVLGLSPSLMNHVAAGQRLLPLAALPA